MKWQPMLLAAGLALSGALRAQDTKPVLVVVPYAAGGSTDVLGRTLAETLARELKQSFVVENVGGAGGTLGSAKVAKAAPDGQTLLFHNMGHAAAPALYKSLPYDTAAAFEPIGLVADVPMILVGRKTLPPADASALLAWIKAQGAAVKVAHAGNGSTTHLCAMLLASALKTEVTLVPYRGTGPALNDLLGGQVDLLCDQPVSTTPHIRSGALKAYAVATRTRLATLPEVATFAEAGLPGFELTVWHGLYAPRGTPRATVQRLSEGLQRALQDTALVQRYQSLAAQPVDTARATPAALQAHVRSEIDRWGPLIRAANVNAD